MGRSWAQGEGSALTMPATGVGAGGGDLRDQDAVLFTKRMQEQNLQSCDDAMQTCNALLKEMSVIIGEGRKELPWFPLYSP